MSDPEDETPAAHGVHAGARDDSGIGEEGGDPPPDDVEDWADKTDTGGSGAS
ncbi:MAG TPA: hypothetical protein VG078_00175 [Acidimicrobiales bacterium]|nr:hypothetical protein [Acidimicrobiales bacterium]